jgi:hypothetical protein
MRQITAGVVDPSTGLVATSTGYIRDVIRGNIIPASLMDTIASSIAGGNYWPTPTNSNLINNFTSAAAAAAHSNEYSGRIDYNFNDNNRINGRWSQKFESTFRL